MKPVSIRFQCFGPYMEEQLINFEELEKNGLFLICGETGAGKTTILDAICYALYCESSGGQRGDIENMRCKLAEKTDKTLVEFIFDSHGRRYKFTRAMKYKTKNLHKYHNCYVFNGTEWEVLESGLSQVTARAEKLVGLTSSQFRQVIILPQGKFEEFLVSDSKKKEEILVTLFNVQQWSRISEEISRRVNQRAAVLDREKSAITEGLRRYGCESLEALACKRGILEEALAVTEVQAEAAAKELSAAEEAWSAGKVESEQFAQLSRMQLRLENLKKQEAQMLRESEILARADQAELLRPAHGDYRAADAGKTKAEKDLSAGYKRLEQGKTDLSRARELMESHETGREQLQQDQKSLLQLEQAREIYASLENLGQEETAARRSLTLAEAELKEKIDELDRCDRDLAAAFDAQEQAKTAYDNAQILYRRGIGGILAATLEDGKPCPVCGSLVHPDPAKTGADHVSEAQLDKLNRALGQSGKAVSAAMKARAQREDARNQAQEKRNAQQQKLDSALERLNMAQSQRINGIETAEELEEKIRGLNRSIRAYEARSRQLLEERTAAEAACTAAELAVADCEKLLAEAAQTLEERQGAWLLALAESCFRAEEDFLEAYMEPARKQKRYQALASWQADRKTAEQSLAEQEALLEGKQKPDLAQLQQIRDAAEQHSRNLQEKRLLDGQYLKALAAEETDLATRLERNRDALMALEADQVFARRISGVHGVSLQRYVLGVMMNSITAQANKLLESVYGGRYKLYRTDETTGRTLKGGLELEVFDSHNSQRRSVRTLSGGEKFLVALSLAIGLSTVVQAQGEGIRLEAMFIDEGFGSLDREAIQDALDILQGIRRTAGVVGIISHVEALAETIPARIEITKGRRGSTARVQGI